MKNWRAALPKNKAIYGLFVFVLLFSLFSQVHFHLHHVETHDHVSIDDNAHSHSADIHGSFDNSHTVNHSEVQVITLQPDISFKYKSSDTQDMPLVVLFVLLLLVPLIKPDVQTLERRSQKVKQYRYHNFPTLRAPPVFA